MSYPFLGEIRLVAFSFPPRGWMLCEGQALPIRDFQALYSLFGSRYGGDDRTTFHLPDLRGRIAIQSGTGPLGDYPVTRQGGTSATAIRTIVSLLPAPQQLPADGRAALMTSSSGSSSAQAPSVPLHVGNDSGAAGSGVTVASAGIGAPALVPLDVSVPPAMPPFLALRYIIAVEGLFPMHPS